MICCDMAYGKTVAKETLGNERKKAKAVLGAARGRRKKWTSLLRLLCGV